MTTFISYSRVNSDFALRLATDLKAAGLDVWLDQLDIPTGARWDDEIEKALDKSKTFLIVLTPESIQSQNVKDEVGYAIDAGKLILPVVIKPCNVPFRLRRFQYVDFTNKAYEESLAEIRHLLTNTEFFEKAMADKEDGVNVESTGAKPEPEKPIGEKQPTMQNNKPTGTSCSSKLALPVIIGGIAITCIAIIVTFIGLASLLSANTTPTSLPANPTTNIIEATITTPFTQTPIDTVTPAPQSNAPIPSPTLSAEDQIVQLVDNYYICINSANPSRDSDYEDCWNLLSDRPGEIQSNLNKNDYKVFWKKYKVTYTLYYCLKNPQNYVDVKYYLYDRNDLSKPIGKGDPNYLEYSFAFDESGWRIKRADASIKGIGSYCESQPRIEKLTLIP